VRSPEADTGRLVTSTDELAEELVGVTLLTSRHASSRILSHETRLSTGEAGQPSDVSRKVGGGATGHYSVAGPAETRRHRSDKGSVPQAGV